MGVQIGVMFTVKEHFLITPDNNRLFNLQRYPAAVGTLASESNSSTPPLEEGAQFCTTHWSVVLLAGSRPSMQSDEALQSLCCIYWYALYAFVRRKGFSVPDAQDLTQAFFAQFLEKQYVNRADPQRGRFRNFLLACLKNFLANQWDRNQTVKRGAAYNIISWDDHVAENQFISEPATGISPEDAYDKRWAERLLQQVLLRFRDEFSASGKIDSFDALKQFLWGPDSSVSFAELSRQLGLSEGAARQLVHRFRFRFRELLRKEVAQTVADPKDVDDELRHLISVISS
jgi:DNA-directed RNA polymerase specialized sigma24 family protein